MDETEAIKHWGGERPYDGVLSMIAKRIEAAFPPEPVEHLAVPGRQRKKFTHKERMTVFRRDSYRCRYCGDDEQLTVDHVVAWSRGGSDELDNLQTLCLSCNSRKGDSDGRPPRPA
ncbi:HNH endonuclease [Mycetocola reblochoni]|nr:HNH endonuclease [Mycetocola reblochoni]